MYKQKTKGYKLNTNTAKVTRPDFNKSKGKGSKKDARPNIFGRVNKYFEFVTSENGDSVLYRKSGVQAKVLGDSKTIKYRLSDSEGSAFIVVPRVRKLTEKNSVGLIFISVNNGNENNCVCLHACRKNDGTYILRAPSFNPVEAFKTFSVRKVNKRLRYTFESGTDLWVLDLENNRVKLSLPSKEETPDVSIICKFFCPASGKRSYQKSARKIMGQRRCL